MARIRKSGHRTKVTSGVESVDGDSIKMNPESNSNNNNNNNRLGDGGKDAALGVKILYGDSEEWGDLPHPGQPVIYDYRTRKEAEMQSENESSKEDEIKCIQWNIERCYQMDQIINTLQTEEHSKADILALQELDIHCARSAYHHGPSEITKSLHKRVIFVAEFEEIWHAKRRNARNQGGGVHGNAVVTDWPIEGVEVIDHVPGYDWMRDGERIGEPRRGGRYTLAVKLRHPRTGLPVLVYSIHLEVFCGIFTRLKQFSQILEHSHRNLQTYPHQLILGDLNTMAHGLARFVPRYCCDALRWRSLGCSEADWWLRNLFSVTPELTGPNGLNDLLAAHHHSHRHHNRQGRESTPIFTLEELKSLINPHLFDPFCYPLPETTLQIRNCYAGKLDWMLLRGWRVGGKGLDNHQYRASDHKLLWVEVEPVIVESGDPGIKAYKDYMEVYGSTSKRRSRLVTNELTDISNNSNSNSNNNNSILSSIIRNKSTLIAVSVLAVALAAAAALTYTLRE